MRQVSSFLVFVIAIGASGIVVAQPRQPNPPDQFEVIPTQKGTPDLKTLASHLGVIALQHWKIIPAANGDRVILEIRSYRKTRLVKTDEIDVTQPGPFDLTFSVRKDPGDANEVLVSVTSDDLYRSLPAAVPEVFLRSDEIRLQNTPMRPSLSKLGEEVLLWEAAEGRGAPIADREQRIAKADSVVIVTLRNVKKANKK